MAKYVTITIYSEDEQEYLYGSSRALPKMEQVESWLRQHCEDVKALYWVEDHTLVCSVFGIDQRAFLEFVRTRDWADEQFLLTFREHYEGRQHPNVYVLRPKYEDQENLKGYLGQELVQVDLDR